MCAPGIRRSVFFLIEVRMRREDLQLKLRKLSVADVVRRAFGVP